MSSYFEKRRFHFAEDHEIGAVPEVIGDMVAGVGTVDRDGQARFPGGLAHEKGQFPVAGEAHLSEKVEIVFAEDNHPRAMAIERAAERFICVFEGAVEQRHFKTVTAQAGSGEQRL